MGRSHPARTRRSVCPSLNLNKLSTRLEDSPKKVCNRQRTSDTDSNQRHSYSLRSTRTTNHNYETAISSDDEDKTFTPSHQKSLKRRRIQIEDGEEEIITLSMESTHQQQSASLSSSASTSTSSPPLPPTQESHGIEVTEEQISTASTPNQSADAQCSKLYEMLVNKEYHDVVIIASNGTEITTHRCVLAKYSKKFADIFKGSTVVPARIELKEYNAATIQSALNFMLEKHDSVDANEVALLKFAMEYDIQDLISFCYQCAASHLPVDASNVCEYVQLAYTKNYVELKKKCLKIMFEKRMEIDRSKMEKLPYNIIIDALLL